jgi:hypothetical protein
VQNKIPHSRGNLGPKRFKMIKEKKGNKGLLEKPEAPR